MAAIMDDEDGPAFCYQEDPDCKSGTQLKDLSIGDPFIFRGERFWKRNAYGWFLGVGNVTNLKGEVSHLHPTTRITLIQ